MSYSIRARLKKRLFKADYVVYDIIEHYQYWDDPSYGNGGGDYRQAERIAGTYACEYEAERAVSALNKYTGEHT